MEDKGERQEDVKEQQNIQFLPTKKEGNCKTRLFVFQFVVWGVVKELGFFLPSGVSGCNFVFWYLAPFHPEASKSLPSLLSILDANVIGVKIVAIKCDYYMGDCAWSQIGQVRSTNFRFGRYIETFRVGDMHTSQSAIRRRRCRLPWCFLCTYAKCFYLIEECYDISVSVQFSPLPFGLFLYGRRGGVRSSIGTTTLWKLGNFVMKIKPPT